MTASIAHDVNQPLAAIVTNANAGLRWLARAEPDLDEVRALLKRIVNDGHRASEVIAGIRSNFATERGEKSAVDVNELVGEVLALARADTRSHRVTLKDKLLDRLPPVAAEREQLRQVFFRLVMNAVEAMDSVAGRERVLTVKSELCDPDHVLITLEDTGTGIDPSHMERIFEAFFTTKPGGVGMGLPICRSIVEAHGGRIWAAARPGYGSVFFVKLPVTSSGTTAV